MTTSTIKAPLRQLAISDLTEVSPLEFCVDVAELQHGKGWTGFPGAFDVPGLGNGQPFIRGKIDRDESGEDVYGVHYQQRWGQVSILIIND